MAIIRKALAFMGLLCLISFTLLGVYVCWIHFDFSNLMGVVTWALITFLYVTGTYPQMVRRFTPFYKQYDAELKRHEETLADIVSKDDELIRDSKTARQNFEAALNRLIKQHNEYKEKLARRAKGGNRLSEKKRVARMAKASEYRDFLQEDRDMKQDDFVEQYGWEFTDNTDSAVKQLQQALGWLDIADEETLQKIEAYKKKSREKS